MAEMSFDDTEVENFIPQFSLEKFPGEIKTGTWRAPPHVGARNQYDVLSTGATEVQRSLSR